MNQLTKEQVDNIKVKFSRYYKYNFTFRNRYGYKVCAGGNKDDIYRCTIIAGKEYTVKQIEEECGGSLVVFKDEEIIYENRW